MSVINAPQTALLNVSGLTISYQRSSATVELVSNASWSVKPGEMVAIVGESGSGKTLSALSVMGLLPAKQGFTTQGSITFSDQALQVMSPTERRRMNGRHIGMVFQDPFRSLNPVYTVGEQVAEGLRFHHDLSRRQAWQQCVDMLAQVGIAQPNKRANDYPHQFSGGQRQRIVLAAALACGPELLIADEPTTALDVTVQAEIIVWLKEWQRQHNTAIVFITHNIALLRDWADTVVVMYAGEVVEHGPTAKILNQPAHPYTQALLEATIDWRHNQVLRPIAGTSPPSGQWPSGCRFHPRCSIAQARCQTVEPVWATSDESRAKCHSLEERVLCEEVAC